MQKMPVAGAAAGAVGSVYGAVLSFAAKAAGTYILNDTNFAGLGKFIPCFCVIAIVPNAGAAGQLRYSTDNGTTFKTLLDFKNTATAGFVVNCGTMVYLDAVGITGVGAGVSTTNTVSITYAGGTADLFFWPMLQQ